MRYSGFTKMYGSKPAPPLFFQWGGGVYVPRRLHLTDDWSFCGKQAKIGPEIDVTLLEPDLPSSRSSCRRRRQPTAPWVKENREFHCWRSVVSWTLVTVCDEWSTRSRKTTRNRKHRASAAGETKIKILTRCHDDSLFFRFVKQRRNFAMFS